MKISELRASIREKIGKGESKKLRREGYIPAILYGGSLGALPIKLQRGEVIRNISERDIEHTVYTMKLDDGKECDVLVKDIQVDPITDEVIHVDFLELEKGKAITVEVPIVIVGKEVCKGVKMGGILEQYLWSVEVECLPRNIPDRIEVDVTNLEMGESIHVEDLQLPEGVKVLEDPETTVVVISEPVEEVVEEAAPAEVAEPEIASKRKKKEEEEEE
ncbi:MAG: 50S ribosomal protein L25/general stress protein Ctc [Synergistetes bacterium]|nr:50S ribosomal protein L25/general stress protein Ctc [Synergistota bacterium]MCX8127294.1 50S ribosomal protein L25/general stress protein Ctc [Synergistota bacterium]MDW8191820.1 50S ribosomal protein L25/general stress protein Ctc [Synergistota bacterium]